MKRLELLDYGRFFAAVMVVLFHYTFNGILNGKISSITHIEPLVEVTRYGYLGVELFFMISGYVIFFSAKTRTPSEFAVSRAIRLYPSYWFAVLFTSFFAILWGQDMMQVHITQIIANLSMIHSFIGIKDVDGVYWSLVYEISFYAAVTICLIAGLQKHLEKVFIAWPFLMLAAILFSMETLPYLGGYYCYFSAGAMFAIIKNKRSLVTIIPLGISFGLCILFSLHVAEAKTLRQGIEYSPYVISAIISAFFLFFLLQNSHIGQSLKLPKSKTLGALTYPVYLIHAHFGYMFLTQFATDSNKIFLYPLTLMIVLGIAYLMHRIIEIKLAPVWKILFNLTLGRFVDYLPCYGQSARVRDIRRTR